MRRERLTPRSNWQKQFDDLGFHFHTPGETYWDESVCYHFTSREIDEIYQATASLHQLCLRAVERIILRHEFEAFALPPCFEQQIIDSWHADSPTLFGRFDLCYDGIGPPKLLEYNADTPTSLVEASIAQWNWQQEVYPALDQFNLLHEKLIARWKALAKDFPAVYFACVQDHAEDQGNLDYIRDTAIQAGIETRPIVIEELGWSATDRSFVDLEDQPIQALFKLYPWEWLAHEEFGPFVPQSKMKVIEPAWKVLLSSKAILPVLWEMEPGHPNLLPCSLAETSIPIPYVKKPRYSREGANVEIHTNGGIIAEAGDYGSEGFVFQAYEPLPGFDGNYPVIGSWIVGDEPAGIGVREHSKRITTNMSCFVPHCFS